MVKFKKSIAMFLAIALMISCLPLSAFAAENSTDGCNHPNMYISGTDRYYTDGGDVCVIVNATFYKCPDCGYHDEYDDFTPIPHAYKVYHATCNGQTQSIQYKCSQCRHDGYTVTQRCPNAPHTGSCIALPASVDIPAEKY